jgi:hypothetical protein
MKKEILSEINEMRMKMGLKVLNEESILLSEASPITTFLERYLISGLLKDTEKQLIRKFVNPAVHGVLTDVEKVELKKFLKSTEGTMFISDLKQTIASDPNIGNQMAMTNWVEKTLEPFANSKILPSGKGSITGKNKNPFSDIESEISGEPNLPKTPKDKELTLSRLREASPKFQLFEHTVDGLPGLTDAEKDMLKFKFTDYSKYTEAQLIQTIQDLRMQVAAPYKRILYNIVKNPIKTMKWTVCAITTITVIKFVLNGAKVVDSRGDQVLTYVQSIGSDVKNDKESVIEFIKGIPELKDFGVDDEPFLTQKQNGVWEFLGGNNRTYRFVYKGDHFEQIK